MEIDILKNIELNIVERVKLINSSNDKDIQQTIMLICKKDPVYFFKYFLYTDRNPWLIPEKFWNAVPFIPFEFQEDFINDAWSAIKMWWLPIEQRTDPTDVFSEKSRQMGFSWVFAGLQLYAFIFHNLKSLYISKKAEEVDKNWDIKSHFEKIRFMIRALPQWILPEWLEKDSWTDYNKFMNISRKDWTWWIMWESANPNAWRWWTFAFVIFDEMAFMQYAWAINMSISSATPCRFFNSTPNWEWNEYFRMKLKALPEWHPNKPKNDPKQTIRYHRCRWDEHPLYTDDWYKWKTSSMTKVQIAQELEIDYNTALEGRVYKDFKSWTETIKYDDSLPLYMFMDNSKWWADPHALIIAQKEWHYINIVDSCEFNCSPRNMAEIVAKQPTITMTKRQLEFYEDYKKMKLPIFISDPYDTHSTTWDNTIFWYYQDVGIFLNIPWNRNKQEQIQITKSNIHRLKVSDTCTDFSSSIQNSIYPEVKEDSMRTTSVSLPVHNWTSHYRTALEYWIVWLVEQEKHFDKPKDRISVESKDPITGDIITKYIYK